MNDSVFREQLVELLKGGHAHAGAKKGLDGVSPEMRGRRPAEGVHSVWEELEHMRIAQEDILRYTLDPSWQSPEWPAGYWPEHADAVTDEMWERSVSGFFADLERAVELVQDTSLDLTSKIPHGEWRTYLRQILLIADHNAYHLGQIVQTRKLLGDW